MLIGTFTKRHSCSAGKARVEDVKPQAREHDYVVMEFDFAAAGSDERDQFLHAQLMLHLRTIAEWSTHWFKDKGVFLVYISEEERRAYPVLGDATHFMIDEKTFAMTFLRT